MNKIFYIGIGGAIGTVTRFLILQIPHFLGFEQSQAFTVLVNVSGSFLLDLMLTVFSSYITKPEIKLGVTTGFLGGYTIFSTFCKESVGLWITGNVIYSGLYLIISVAFGLAAVWSGMETGKYMLRRNAG